MERTETVELTVLCLIHQGDRLLLQNRRKKDWDGWTLPGGHIEKGESIVDAVVREMQEETRLTIHSPKLCGIKQFPIENGRYLVFLFRTESFSGEVRSSDEGEMRWISRSELSDFHTVPDFEELLQVMLDDRLTEFLYVVDGEAWNISLK